MSRILCLIMFVAVASGATWQGKLPLKPSHLAHKEGCYVKEIDDVIPFGKTVSPIGFCYRIECYRDIIAYASCGVVGIAGNDNNCFITDEDLSKSYPECCPNVKCEVDNYLI
ncbi:uncharacterized protein LOC126966685 [Leptidea sinapis]|uniref:Single domain-containing protein n=1 Tax=Leptidea sinapis TaxID=189913 RepID=A0A5E4QE24_9NEOP|nr:uncharacterized protein LOC126966685 [Leptidea sinapis]VVC96533.1 unnamed protein product [Leptidea sinapis]